MKTIMLSLLLVLAASSAFADETAPAIAPDNALAGLKLDKYLWKRDSEITLEAGRRFLDDLGAVSPEIKANVVEAARYEIQKEETAKFAHQQKFVLSAYAAIWVILVLFVVGLYARQRKLGEELAELEARVAKEKQ